MPSARPHKDIVATYVADVVERCHALEDIAENLKYQEYVSEESRALIEVIQRLAVESRVRVIECWSSYQKHKHLDDLRILEAHDIIIRKMTGELRLPARATSDRVPGVLTRLIKVKVKTIEETAGIILRPQWNYNYRIFTPDFYSLYTRRAGAIAPNKVAYLLKGLPSPLYIISFPILERGSIHLHSVLGHEIGHLLARKFSASKRMEKKFLDAIKGMTDQDQEQRVTKARACAIVEFAADAASVYMFGIAAVLGASQVAAGGRTARTISRIDGEYPSWGLRLFYILKLAERRGWLDLSRAPLRRAGIRGATNAVAERLSQIRQWVGKRPSKWRSTDPNIRMGHDHAEAVIGQIHTFFEDNYSFCFSDPQKTYDALPTLLSRLVQGLPPDNVGLSELSINEPSLEEIFAASWWFKLRWVRPRFGKKDLSPAIRLKSQDVRKLTLKAIENVDFVTRFQREVERAKKRGRGSL